MIKKLSSLTLILALIAIPVAARAGKGRTVSGTYNTFVVSTDPGSPEANGSISNGVSFMPHEGEHFVSVKIVDKSGLPAPAIVGQDLDHDGVVDTSHDICGASTVPIAFRPGYRVEIWTQDGPCDDGTAAASTFGKITATFTH